MVFFSKNTKSCPHRRNYAACSNSHVFAVRQVMEEMSRQVVTFQVNNLGHSVNIILLDISPVGLSEYRHVTLCSI